MAEEEEMKPADKQRQVLLAVDLLEILKESEAIMHRSRTNQMAAYGGNPYVTSIIDALTRFRDANAKAKP